MAEHHFIVKYDDETKTWSHDVDSEEVRFPDGTIWNESLGTWDYSYQGEGKFYPMPEGKTSDELDLKFSRFVESMDF